MQKIKIDDFKNYNFLSQLKYSPNGDKIAVVAKQANKDNGYNSVIYLKKEGDFYPLTNVNGSISNYIWLDNDNILFSEIRDEKVKERIKNGEEITSFYKINTYGGEAVKEFDIPLSVRGIELIEGDKFLLSVKFDNSRPELEGKSDSEKKELLAEYKKEQDYQVVDELPYWFNGAGFVNKTRTRLYTYSVKDGLKPITGNLDYVNGHKLSDDGKKLVYGLKDMPNGVLARKDSLMLYDFDKDEVKEILDDTYYIKSYDFYGDKLIIGLALGEKHNMHEHPTIYSLDLNTLEKEEIITIDTAIGSSPGSDCKFGGGEYYKVSGDNLYFIALDNYYSEIYKVDLSNGNMEKITNSQGAIDMFDINDSGISVVGMKDGRLQEVYSINEKELNLISGFNTKIKEEYAYSQPKHMTFIDSEGVEVDGWVILPIDFNEDKKYPTILDIHGGPKTAFGDVYFHEMQYWASEGYMVIFCNPRGSDGKGNEFAEIRGKYGMIDYENIMEFVDEAIKLYPQIDEDKMGVTGGSYGGFMTNWIIGHTNRFKAAASQRSISNWISFSNICDIGYYFGPDQTQGDTWKNVEKMWWHSPLKYADKAETPTLFIHSDEDYRCWIPEAYQMYNGLKLHGVESRICIFHGENHELSRSGKPEHRVRRLSEITTWMDKYLK